MASMVGANRRLRRPILRGALLALPASALLFVARGPAARPARPVRREAGGDRRAGRDRRALTGAQLVLPQGLLDRVDRRPPQAQQGAGRRPRPAASPRARPCSGSTCSASPASSARASRRCSSCRRCSWRPAPGSSSPGSRSGLVGVAASGAVTFKLERAPALQADADRHRRADLAGAGGDGRQHRPHAAGRRLGLDHADRPRAAALDGHLAGPVPDLGDARRPARPPSPS